MKPNYQKLLREAREKKFEKLEETQVDNQQCNYSNGDKCIACTHPNWCIFDNKRINLEETQIVLQNKIKDLENYLKNGKGTVGYDKMKIRVEILKTKKELKEANEDINRFKRKR